AARFVASPCSTRWRRRLAAQRPRRRRGRGSSWRLLLLPVRLAQHHSRPEPQVAVEEGFDLFLRQLLREVSQDGDVALLELADAELVVHYLAQVLAEGLLPVTPDDRDPTLHPEDAKELPRNLLHHDGRVGGEDGVRVPLFERSVEQAQERREDVGVEVGL